MRNSQKQELLEMINTLHHVHEEIREALHQQNIIFVQNMLSECQQSAISLGEKIEQSEGEGHSAVQCLEEYCEILFQIYEEITNTGTNENKIYKKLRKLLLKAESSIKNEIPVKKEIVFFPYKASMWDSLESIYLAAKADTECTVFCVPIPYYDINSNGSLGQIHDERNAYPSEIEVTDWQTYQFEERKPDIIYIHNPYDNCNLVTSVHPRYYSANLKKYTDTLVYVPYYSTAGGMSEGQKLCPAYLNADYIVIQAPKFRSYFDKNIPDKKFLPFGSPKFDRIIHKCNHPPQPPKAWRDKLAGKKVYFYNTSIGGMLDDTDSFLKKLTYVFSRFEKREDVCILWRPHPLLESTFDSMRPQYRQVYDAIKKDFIEKGYGIYDDTADMSDAIALSDAYIGDAGTSVISLYGIVGKPIFILNNRLHSMPDKDSWRGEISAGFIEQGRFTVTQGNKLYLSEPNQYDYSYCCDLSDYAYGNYYATAWEINGTIYVCPANAQDILVIGRNGIERKIELEQRAGADAAFWGSWKYDRYLVLMPFSYPAVVRYDTVLDEITYLCENIDVFIREEDGRKLKGGSCICQGVLYSASPTDNQIYALDIKSGQTQVLRLPVASWQGCIAACAYQDEIWMLPYKGKIVLCWNPRTGAWREYRDFPEEFVCIHPFLKRECEERPFGSVAFFKDELYLTPDWGNLYLKMNLISGKAEHWAPPFEDGTMDRPGKEYFFPAGKSIFLWDELCVPSITGNIVKMYAQSDRKYYSVNLETNTCEEIPIRFDVEELKRHNPGFCKSSEWIRYVCFENAFNALDNFLDGSIAGNPFDREKQLEAYREIAANNDGSCGQKVHQFVCCKNND